MNHLSEYQLLDYHSGELKPEEISEITRHLKLCLYCKAEYLRLKQDLEQIYQEFPPEPDKVFWASYLARLKVRMEPPYSHQRRFLQQGATVFATVTVTALLVLFFAGGFYAKIAPLHYEEWASNYLYDSMNSTIETDAFNYALAQMADFSYAEVSPAEEEEVLELLRKLPDEDIEKIFETIKSEKLF
jgi:hypothetical protein